MKKIDTSNMKRTLTSSARTGFSPLLFGQCLFPDELVNFSADNFSNIFWAFQRWPNEEDSPNMGCMSSELPSLFHPIPLPLSWLEWGITETIDEKIKSQDTVSPTYCTHSSSSASSIKYRIFMSSLCSHGVYQPFSPGQFAKLAEYFCILKFNLFQLFTLLSCWGFPSCGGRVTELLDF